MFFSRLTALCFGILSAAATSFCTVQAQAADSQESVSVPNILWITSEDNAAHWLGCYGNSDAETPVLDTLARDSILFRHAYSNAPVCAIARSTLLHGVYAVTLGTQHMRSRYAIPASIKPYVSYLQELGYYCTNNQKTDYNRKGGDQDIWDACNKTAHYKNRTSGQPFFSIFNLTVCHESALFPENVAANRQRGIIPATPRLDAAQVQLPPHLPDLPEVRSDIAIYHDYMTALDRQVGAILDDLKADGLENDTIVFYYADHGGVTPRGKRYLTDTGVRVPMIVHVPKKWQHLSIFQPGQQVDELVSFIDLAPTLLSLGGQEKPAQMQGRAFLGVHRAAPDDQPIVYLFGDRFDEVTGMRRGLTDGHFKYIRRFTSHLAAAPCCQYALRVPSWAAWMQAWQENRLPPESCQIWESPQPVEELYDVDNDPWEIYNLAADPSQADRLKQFRNRLAQEMIATYDTGILPETMFHELAGQGTLYDYVRSEQFYYERIHKIAFLASSGDSENLPMLALGLADEDPIVRYWTSLGCVILGKHAESLEPQLTSLLEDPKPTVRITAALALYEIGKQQQGKEALLAELENLSSGQLGVMLYNSLAHLKCESEIPDRWIKRVLSKKDENHDLLRIAKFLAAQREP